MIADVIRNADTEHTIYFLLTDYIETMRRSEIAFKLPLQVTRLPLAGRADVNERFRKLIIALHEPSKKLDYDTSVGITEALRVFGAAVCGLTLLERDGMVHLELSYDQAA